MKKRKKGCFEKQFAENDELDEKLTNNKRLLARTIKKKLKEEYNIAIQNQSIAAKGL